MAKSRNYSLDIIRIVAFCSVVGVHFFLNTDFYNTGLDTPLHLLMVIVRCFNLVCVPLFILLTGYLMNKKTLSKKYFLGIVKTLSIYILISIPCYFHHQYFTGRESSLRGLILGISGFTAAKYSWYIEMYIGLFLLIPFLNLIYNNLKSKNHKRFLIIILICLSILPTILNTYNLIDANWWLAPAFSNKFNNLIPSYWESIYPITYYFIGAYLSEFKIKTNSCKLFIGYLVTGIIFGVYCFYRSYNHVFVSGNWQNWNGFPVMIMSVSLFAFLSKIKTDNLNTKIKSVLKKLSDLCLGAYLASSLVDDLIYNFIGKMITDELNEQFKYYPICVLVVIILSFLLSYLTNIIYEILYTIVSKICVLVKKAN